nr:hypothetical protein [Mycolicibacterium grossiae]
MYLERHLWAQAMQPLEPPLHGESVVPSAAEGMTAGEPMMDVGRHCGEHLGMVATTDGGEHTPHIAANDPRQHF